MIGVQDRIYHVEELNQEGGIGMKIRLEVGGAAR